MEWGVLTLNVLVFINMIAIVVWLSRKNKPKETKKASHELVDIVNFFTMGGVVYYRKENGKWQKCKTYEEFLKIKADYVEFWLNQKRYIFESQLSKS